MRLPKPTRKLLASAEGKTREIPWPPSAPEAVRGRKYPIHNKDGHKAFEIRLESVSRTPEGIVVVAKVDGDPFRPMIGLKGTRSEQGDYQSEPERVDARTETLLAQDGRQKTTLAGASNRQDAKEARAARRDLDQEIKEAKAKGWTKSVKTLERIGRAA